MSTLGDERLQWMSQARCRDFDPDELFVRGAAQRQAVLICRHCPVVTQCAAEALDNRLEFGVWGGMTERQRRALLKANPNVTSWAEYFAGHRGARAESRPAQRVARRGELTWCGS